MAKKTLFIDPSLCTGCRACESACCDAHDGRSMVVVVDFSSPTEKALAPQPTLCMHCEEPLAPCAEACPVDAIPVAPDGVVEQADPSICVGCDNCVYACPFGIPRIDLASMLMRKCDLCHARTEQGQRPWCAEACPTEAIWWGTDEELAAAHRGRAAHRSVLRGQEVQARVACVVPDGRDVTSPIQGRRRPQFALPHTDLEWKRDEESEH